MRFAEVTLEAPLDLRGFYGGELGLPLDGDAIVVGETRMRFRVEQGGAFYHFALLVPGDRFDAALAWARERVELLGDEVFDFEEWDARAVYFHDPAGSIGVGSTEPSESAGAGFAGAGAGNIVELIAHHGLGEDGRSGGFTGEELVGFSELGLVGDRPLLLGQLEAIGLDFWDGTIEEPGRLAFVGERGRTFILAPPGRGWLPTGRPAEPHPVEATLAGLPNQESLVTVCYLSDCAAGDGEKAATAALSNRLLLG